VLEKIIYNLAGRKISSISDIKLIRTDTTLDLSQKAEEERTSNGHGQLYKRFASETRH